MWLFNPAPRGWENKLKSIQLKRILFVFVFILFYCSSKLEDYCDFEILK